VAGGVSGDYTWAGCARSCIEKAGGLVNLVGLAKRMGVSKSTAHWHANRDDFPAPLHYEGQSGPVKLWLAGEVDAYMERRRG
jgi:predicted DNA-binding transcriptional regulator AlpA